MGKLKCGHIFQSYSPSHRGSKNLKIYFTVNDWRYVFSSELLFEFSQERTLQQSKESRCHWGWRNPWRVPSCLRSAQELQRGSPFIQFSFVNINPTSRIAITLLFLPNESVFCPLLRIKTWLSQNPPIAQFWHFGG